MRQSQWRTNSACGTKEDNSPQTNIQTVWRYAASFPVPFGWLEEKHRQEVVSVLLAFFLNAELTPSGCLPVLNIHWTLELANEQLAFRIAYLRTFPVVEGGVSRSFRDLRSDQTCTESRAVFEGTTSSTSVGKVQGLLSRERWFKLRLVVSTMLHHPRQCGTYLFSFITCLNSDADCDRGSWCIDHDESADAVDDDTNNWQWSQCSWYLLIVYHVPFLGAEVKDELLASFASWWA